MIDEYPKSTVYKEKLDGNSRTPGQILGDIQGGIANLSRQTRVAVASPGKYADPACDPKSDIDCIMDALQEDIHQLRRKLRDGTGRNLSFRNAAIGVTLSGRD